MRGNHQSTSPPRVPAQINRLRVSDTPRIKPLQVVVLSVVPNHSPGNWHEVDEQADRSRV